MPIHPSSITDIVNVPLLIGIDERLSIDNGRLGCIQFLSYDGWNLYRFFLVFVDEGDIVTLIIHLGDGLRTAMNYGSDATTIDEKQDSQDSNDDDEEDNDTSSHTRTASTP